MTTVFISATSFDLSPYVKEVEKSLRDARHQVITMASFRASPDTPRRASLQEVEQGEYFVGLYAWRYGYIPEGHTLSVTEQEYHHARKNKKPVFAFVVDAANTELKPGPGEDDGSEEAIKKQEKLQAFIAGIETALVRDTFVGIEDLCIKVLVSLSRYEKRMTVLQPPVDTLRIQLDEEVVELFHNDLPIGSAAPALDSSWQHELEGYQRAKSLSANLTTKDRSGQAAGAVEMMAGRIGRRLGELLITFSAAKMANELTSEWQSAGTKAQVALQAAVAPWKQLPLETLVLPDQNRPLALTPYLDFFRMGRDRGQTICPDIPGPLKILIAVAAPWEGETGTVLDYERELGKVMDIVEQLPDFAQKERKPIVHILDQGTLDSICDAFQRNRYHVLHISCHGQPGALHLENEDGTVDTVTAKKLVARFPADRQPVLTVLSACHTGAAGKLSSFAEHLVQNGFAYAVAMQETVSDAYATAFAEAFYRYLAYAENPVIENGFSQVRIRLEEQRVEKNTKLPPEQQLPPEWMIPALYKGGVERHAVFEPRSERYDRRMERPTESFDPGIAHRRVGEFVGRRRELLTLKNEVLAVKNGGAALVTGMGGVGKSTLVARALADRIQKGESFNIVPVIGRISLVDVLKDLECEGQELDQLTRYFFQTWLPEHGPKTVFLFDNFEQNLFSADRELPRVPTSDEDFELDDASTARFLAQLIFACKTRILITCRYPFKLPDRQHRRMKTIGLGALSLTETRKLMDRLSGFASMGPKDRHQAARIIGGHPRTLELLDAILADGRFTYPDVGGRLLKKLPDEALDRLKSQLDLTDSLREAAVIAARDCFVDQLLELLSPPEKELLFLFSVFQEPRPIATLKWLVDRKNLAVDAKAAVDQLMRLSLVTPHGEKLAVHRWTAEYLKTIMGEDFWKEANHLAGDHLLDPKKISIDDAYSAWQHYLESEDLETAHNVACELEDKLHTWGHWDLRRIVCETMIEHSPEFSKIHAQWLLKTGMLMHDLGEIEKACSFHQEALIINKKIGNEDGIALVFLELGNIKQQKGELSDASKLLLNSLIIYKKIDNQLGMADSYHGLGIISQQQGDYKEARSLYQNSLRIRKALGDLNGLAFSYHNLGLLNFHEGKYDEARKLYAEALKIRKKLLNLKGVADSFLNLGTVEQIQGNYEDAFELFSKSLAIYEELGGLKGMADCNNNLGIIYQQKEDFDGASSCYQKAFSIYDKLKNTKGMAQSLYQMGTLMHKVGSHFEAFSNFLNAFLLLKTFQSPEAKMVLGVLCKVTFEHPGYWKGWLEDLIEDEESRSQIEKMILQATEDGQNQRAEALKNLKALYDRIGEEALLAEFKAQSGEDLPEELLRYLRSDL